MGVWARRRPASSPKVEYLISRGEPFPALSAKRSRERPASSGLAIQNIVASVDIGARIDLAALAAAFADVVYEPAHYFAAKVPLRQQRGKALVNSSGRAILVGVREFGGLGEAVADLVRRLRSAGFTAVVSEPTIQNVVATFQVNLGASLTQAPVFLRNEGLEVEFEPEQFPGAIIRFPGIRVTFLLFASGAVTLTGAKGEGDMMRLHSQFMDVGEKTGLFSPR